MEGCAWWDCGDDAAGSSGRGAAAREVAAYGSESGSVGAAMTVGASPDRSCCGIWPKVYWAGDAPGTRVNVQMTSKRSPGHGAGITVPATVGKAVARAGMWSCSQQMSTTLEYWLTTAAASCGSSPSA